MIAAGNIGCITQIATGTGIPVVHTVELIDWATGGPAPEGLRTEWLSAAPATAGGNLKETSAAVASADGRFVAAGRSAGR